MEPSNFYHPVYAPFMPGEDSVPSTLMQQSSSNENLKWEQGARSQPPGQHVQPPPPPTSSSPPSGSQPVQSSIIQRPWPEIQLNPHLQLQESQETEPDPAVAKPSSKRYIRELHGRIEELEKSLRESELRRRIQAREIMTLYELNQFPSYHPSPLIQSYPENVIAYLCDGRYHMDGRLKYGGPTSSLHLTLKEQEAGEPWSALGA
ncbi:hypothetical protein RJZ90_006952 [Blastomyces dermatitidis]